MFDTDFPRDLFMTAAIFGFAAFIWAGWGHERPLKHWIWRVVLVIVQLGGAMLAGFGIPLAVLYWEGSTAITVGGPAFIAYIVTFWLEVAVIIVLMVWAARRGRKDLFAPLILTVVGIHFIPLAWVFAQPIFALTGVLMTAIGVMAALVPDHAAARSFWCGLLGGTTLLVVGALCLFTALDAPAV